MDASDSSSSDGEFFDWEQASEPDQDKQAEIPARKDPAPDLAQSATRPTLNIQQQQQQHHPQHQQRAPRNAARSEGIRHSLQQPAVPPIPLQYAQTGYPALTASATSASHALEEPTRVKRASRLSDNAARRSLLGTIPQVDLDTLSKLEGIETAPEEPSAMARPLRDRNSDLFRGVADSSSGGEREATLSNRAERVAHRSSYASKRNSMPAKSSLVTASEARPSTSGNSATRAPSRAHPTSIASNLQQHVDRYRTPPSHAQFQPDDARSISSRSHLDCAHRFSQFPDHSVASPSRLSDHMRSSEAPRRRPSIGVASSSAYRRRDSQHEQEQQALEPSDFQKDYFAARGFETRQTDSASTDSQPADTVWDEVDDLKSRIKKLGASRKLPTSSSAAASGDSSDRPRTATTAPTTTDSSPKHDRKPESGTVRPLSSGLPNVVIGATTANFHLLLHEALAKAKPLLQGSLYRTLEATASDALQLAAMTGSGGPQGTTYTAASIINGAIVPDRQVRRKADTMCRNLTDLCLALCEGKLESPGLTPSPMALELPKRQSSMARYPRHSLSPGIADAARPVSRLEARKSSILGAHARHARPGHEELSASEHETSTHPHIAVEQRRVGRVSSGFLRNRLLRPEGADLIDDDDPTIRPPSRARTEAGGLRSRLSTGTNLNGQQSLASLRDDAQNVSSARRINERATESNRELSRVASFGSDIKRRRFYEHSTPPVLEEDGQDEFPATSQPRRGLTSFGGRRVATDIDPGRVSSLNQRRHIIVE